MSFQTNTSCFPILKIEHANYDANGLVGSLVDSLVGSLARWFNAKWQDAEPHLCPHPHGPILKAVA